MQKNFASDLGLASEKTKTADTPKNRDGMEACARHRQIVSPLLSGEDTKQYRSSTMRAAYTAMDRPDLGNCVKNEPGQTHATTERS